MSDAIDMHAGALERANQLLARAAVAESRAWRMMTVSLDDFFLPDAARMDERTRAALSALLAGVVDAAEAAIRGHAARLLAARGEGALADALAEGGSVLARLTGAGVLRDVELMAELLARVRQDLLSAAMPAEAPDDA